MIALNEPGANGTSIVPVALLSCACGSFYNYDYTRTKISPPYVWPDNDILFAFVMILTERARRRPAAITINIRARQVRTSRDILRRKEPSSMTAGFG